MRRISPPHMAERRTDPGHGVADWTRQWAGKRDPRLLHWAVVIGLECVALIVARDTPYHQLTIGILAATVVLLVLLSLLEMVWRVLERARSGFDRT